MYSLTNVQDTQTVATDTELNFYVNFQNPYDVYDMYQWVLDGNAENTFYYNAHIPFDMLYMRFKYAVTGTSPNLAMTIVKHTDEKTTFGDHYCLKTLAAGAWDTSKCLIDSNIDGHAGTTGQDWSEPSAPANSNYCVETWDIKAAGASTTNHQRCVRLSATVKRFFHTGKNSTTNTQWADINLAYRAFSVTTGWRIPNGASASPGLQDFAGVKVDFSTFERAAETYTGAIYGLAMAGSAAAVGALAMSF